MNKLPESKVQGEDLARKLRALQKKVRKAGKKQSAQPKSKPTTPEKSPEKWKIVELARNFQKHRANQFKETKTNKAHSDRVHRFLGKTAKDLGRSLLSLESFLDQNSKTNEPLLGPYTCECDQYLLGQATKLRSSEGEQRRQLEKNIISWCIADRGKCSVRFCFDVGELQHHLATTEPKADGTVPFPAEFQKKIRAECALRGGVTFTGVMTKHMQETVNFWDQYNTNKNVWYNGKSMGIYRLLLNRLSTWAADRGGHAGFEGGLFEGCFNYTVDAAKWVLSSVLNVVHFIQQQPLLVMILTMASQMIRIFLCFWFSQGTIEGFIQAQVLTMLGLAPDSLIGRFLVGVFDVLVTVFNLCTGRWTWMEFSSKVKALLENLKLESFLRWLWEFVSDWLSNLDVNIATSAASVFKLFSGETVSSLLDQVLPVVTKYAVEDGVFANLRPLMMMDLNAVLMHVFICYLPQPLLKLLLKLYWWLMVAGLGVSAYHTQWATANRNAVGDMFFGDTKLAGLWGMWKSTSNFLMQKDLWVKGAWQVGVIALFGAIDSENFDFHRIMEVRHLAFSFLRIGYELRVWLTEVFPCFFDLFGEALVPRMLPDLLGWFAARKQARETAEGEFWKKMDNTVGFRDHPNLKVSSCCGQELAKLIVEGYHENKKLPKEPAGWGTWSKNFADTFYLALGVDLSELFARGRSLFYSDWRMKVLLSSTPVLSVPHRKGGRVYNFFAYYWKNYLFGSHNTLHIGLMAQDVQKVRPSAVGRREDGRLYIKYDRLPKKIKGLAQYMFSRSNGENWDLFVQSRECHEFLRT
jgi:hypothetical protein